MFPESRTSSIWPINVRILCQSIIKMKIPSFKSCAGKALAEQQLLGRGLVSKNEEVPLAFVYLAFCLQFCFPLHLRSCTRFFTRQSWFLPYSLTIGSCQNEAYGMCCEAFKEVNDLGDVCCTAFLLDVRLMFFHRGGMSPFLSSLSFESRT